MASSADQTPTWAFGVRALLRGNISPISFDWIKTLARCAVAVGVILYVNDLVQDARGGMTDGLGHAIGDDFINFWSGPFLAWHHRAAEIYNLMAFHAFEQSVVGQSLQNYHYSYPPTLLVLMAPFALVPYLPGLAIWLISGWFAFYRAVRLAMPKGGALLLAAATPAAFLNTIGGQTGTWTAALFGVGLGLLDRQPIFAGVCLGLFVNKPQLGLLIPLALVAGRRWQALASAAITATALIAIATLCFGVDIYGDYLQQLTRLRHLILDGAGVDPWGRMISAFVAARRLGADVPQAYAVQVVFAAIAAFAVVVAWFRGASFGARNALLVLGTCMATPYLQDYDMVFGALVVAWLWNDPSVRAQIPESPLFLASAALLLLPMFPLFFSGLDRVIGFHVGALFGLLSFAPLFVIAARCALATPRAIGLLPAEQ
jgi:arabinofuranan 3-O-arabinosyltransferase